MLVSGFRTLKLRHAAIAFACATLLGATWARANELQDANRLFKAGQDAG
jgi:hypothetical protein